MNIKSFLCGALVFLCCAAGVQAQQKARTRTEPVAAGASAPDFALTDQNDRTVTLSEAKKPVVLIFYRGHW